MKANRSKKVETVTEMPYGEGSTTVRLSNVDKIKLLKVGARMLLDDGQSRTMEEIIHFVILEFEKTHKDWVLGNKKLEK